jgi:two-component system, NarL family, sensor kinase
MQIQSSELIAVIIASSVILLLLAAFMIIFAMAYQRRYYKYQQELARIKDSYEQEILRTQLEIQEQTLRNVSQEIHDNLGQILSLVKMNLNTLHLDATTGQDAELVKDTKDLVSNVITDMRNLSKSLKGDKLLRLGLTEALRADVNMLNKSGNYEATLTVSGEEYRLDKQKEIVIYRIAQEAMNNIIKHARAKKTDLNLHYSPGTFTFSIKDDGIGFQAEPLLQTNAEQGGSGLRNMRDRAALINATLNMTSNTGNGTTITVILPVSH